MWSCALCTEPSIPVCTAAASVQNAERPAWLSTEGLQGLQGCGCSGWGMGVGGGVQVRLAGDRCVLVEYGPMELDLKLRVRIWALQAALADAKVPPPSSGDGLPSAHEPTLYVALSLLQLMLLPYAGPCCPGSRGSRKHG